MLRTLFPSLFPSLMLALLLIPGLRGEDKVPHTPRRYVAVVGASAYKGSGFEEVTEALRDAGDVADLFEQNLGYEDLKGKERKLNPTRSQLEEWLDEMTVEVNGAEDLIFFITGHGYLVDPGQQASFIPIPEDGKGLQPIAAKDLVAKVFRMKVKHILIILHFCYAGKRQAFDLGKEEGVRQVIASSISEAEQGEHQNSPFTAALLRIIRKSIAQYDLPDRMLTSTELGNQLAAEAAMSDPPFAQPELPSRTSGQDFTIDLDIKEKDEYQHAVSNHRAEGFAKYLQDFPSGTYRRQAQAALNTIAQQAKRSESGGINDPQRDLNLQQLIGSSTGADREPNPAACQDENKQWLYYRWVPTTGQPPYRYFDEENEIAFDPEAAFRGEYSGFWIAETETPVWSYRDVTYGCQNQRQEPGAQIKTKPRQRAPAFNRDWSKDWQPIVNVSYQDALTYCKAVGGDLPTDQQWFYAAKALGNPGNINFLGPGRLNVRDRQCQTSTGKRNCAVYVAVAVDDRHFVDRNNLKIEGMFGNVSEIIRAGDTSPSGDTMNTRGANFTDQIYPVKGQQSNEFDNAINVTHTADIHGENTVGFRCVIDVSGP